MSLLSRVAVLALLVIATGCDSLSGGGLGSLAFQLDEDSILQRFARVMDESGQRPVLEDLETRSTAFAASDDVFDRIIENSGMTADQWYAETDLESFAAAHLSNRVVGRVSFEPGFEIKMRSGAVYTIVPADGPIGWGLDSDDEGDEADVMIQSVVAAENGRIVKLNRMLSF